MLFSGDAQMIPEYFETRFRTQKTFETWPDSFVIITAYATTGEVWSDEENRSADLALKSTLSELNRGIRRITGYSPRTNHSEPGWAVEVEIGLAKKIGRNFLQDAIYYVKSDKLWVVGCNPTDRPILVDDFSARLD